MTKFGIYDTQDDCWLGDDTGPKTFDDFPLARIAAQMLEAQILGNDLAGRFRAEEIPENVWNLKDELPVKKSALDALRRIEIQ